MVQIKLLFFLIHITSFILRCYYQEYHNKLSGLFYYLMPDGMLYFCIVFIVPPFSKKIKGKLYIVWFVPSLLGIVQEYILCTLLLLLHFLKVV